MLDDTFYLDGVCARSAGIKLQSPLKFSAPVPVVETEKVRGRNGYLVYETGAYENRIGTAKCFALQTNVEVAIRSANKYLMKSLTYRRLEDSNDPHHFWLARVSNGARLEQRMRLLAPFEITFDCKPQRFVKSGEYPVSFESDGVLFNSYGFDAMPIIKVYGTGSGNIYVGETEVAINCVDGVLILDSDLQDAYNDDGNQNMSVYAPRYPVLTDGENVISFDGDIERMEIIPRWWEL